MTFRRMRSSTTTIASFSSRWAVYDGQKGAQERELDKRWINIAKIPRAMIGSARMIGMAA